MKISQKLQKSLEEDRVSWSFEYFPPKTEEGVTNLYERLERMYELGPEFIDVTWGAGGSTSELTLEICSVAENIIGLPTCMHLTCTNMDPTKIDNALKEAEKAGIQNILALRGDPPRGQLNWTACENGFSYAADLVKYIRKNYGDYFCISVAGYPEGHIENPDKEADLKNLKKKVDSGADYIVTQLFYDVDLYLEWIQKCRNIGINCPIIPGIMPIQNYGGFKKMTTLCKTHVPQDIFHSLEPIKDDDQAVKNFGVDLAVEMCLKLYQSGVRAFHFYTLNLEKSISAILEKLEFVVLPHPNRPLPWKGIPNKNRIHESVRPIHWANRSKSYAARTISWDEFPNGRWGDSRSPAFGELDGYGMTLKLTREEAQKIWPEPHTMEDLFDIFAAFCSGNIPFLPWCEEELKPESGPIQDDLIKINKKGFLTINSQPKVNGQSSSNKVVGWGPKNGYVYQKEYLEFFVSPEKFDAIENAVNGKYNLLTYFASKRLGTIKTNMEHNEPMAVTWGVFPGKEIVQPTIVEEKSFLAWKDEAFTLWDEWKKIYPDGSSAKKLIEEIRNEWFLVTVVDNDFVKGNIFELFESF